MTTEKFKIHPAAAAFPMMDQARFEELKNDIKAHGQRLPITLLDGKVLDGRNRLRACEELGLEPKTRELRSGMNGVDPWAYVWSLNGQRRDLSEKQRALIFVEVRKHSPDLKAALSAIQAQANEKRSEAAKAQHRISNPRAGERLVVGSKNPLPDDADRHKGRTIKASFAGVGTNAIKFAEALSTARPDLAKAAREGKIKPAEAQRLAKKEAVAEKVKALPPDKFSVIYADPPWAYSDKQGGSISENYGAAEKHYPSMPLSELKALNVPGLSAENCVLFLWATCPLLEYALDLALAWGFIYKAQFIWDKVRHNMGHYNSVRHELLLICTRGSATPENVKLFDSVQTIERKEHSAKPEEFRKIIETLYPSGKKIELFRRGDAPKGWTVWGNEA